MSKELLEIQKILRKKSDKRVKESSQRFVPSSEKIYGVKALELNKLALKYKKYGFNLVEELWNSGSLEEKILSAKILGKICKKDPEKTLKIVKRFSKKISDWAVCDTLATQGIRGITKEKQKEIFNISKKLIKSKNFWQRRFGIVLLINFTKDKTIRKDIKRIIKNIKDDNYYVKKAIKWIERELNNNQINSKYHN